MGLPQDVFNEALYMEARILLLGSRFRFLTVSMLFSLEFGTPLCEIGQSSQSGSYYELALAPL